MHNGERFHSDRPCVLSKQVYHRALYSCLLRIKVISLSCRTRCMLDLGLVSDCFVALPSTGEDARSACVFGCFQLNVSVPVDHLFFFLSPDARSNTNGIWILWCYDIVALGACLISVYSVDLAAVCMLVASSRSLKIK